MSNLNSSYKDYALDVLRLIVLGLIAWWLIKGDYSLSAVYVSIGVSLLIVAVSHFTRRLAFPRISLYTLAQTAAREPLGAALVFCGVVYFLVALVNLQGGLLVGMLK
ncbi:MAG: hypothetical protein WC091_19850 [Sulfuricellaceae bacterium]